MAAYKESSKPDFEIKLKPTIKASVQYDMGAPPPSSTRPTRGRCFAGSPSFPVAGAFSCAQRLATSNATPANLPSFIAFSKAKK